MLVWGLMCNEVYHAINCTTTQQQYGAPIYKEVKILEVKFKITYPTKEQCFTQTPNFELCG